MDGLLREIFSTVLLTTYCNCNCKYDNLYSIISSKLLLWCFTRLSMQLNIQNINIVNIKNSYFWKLWQAKWTYSALRFSDTQPCFGLFYNGSGHGQILRGSWGAVPLKFEVGDCPCFQYFEKYCFVFREVVLLQQMRQSTRRIKRS